VEVDLDPKTLEADVDPTTDNLPFSNDLFLAASDPQLLQPRVDTDIKAVEALDVVVDVVSLPMVDVVDVLVQLVQPVLAMPKKKLLFKLRLKIPHLPILIPTSN